jgi:hypothetical protein
MNFPNKFDKARPTLKRMKRRANEASRSRGVSHCKALDAQTKQLGAHSFAQEARERSQANPDDALRNGRLFVGGVEGNGDCIVEPRPIYSRSLGGCVWSLEIGAAAPELWLRRPRGVAPERASQLGLFPVLHRPQEFEKGRSWWVLSRYGNQFPVDLPELSDTDALTLARAFGISIAGKRRQDHQIRSEQLFLQSEAFAALRSAIRQGTVVQPRLDAWCYGLSPVWSILIAMGDEHFSGAGAGATKYVESRPRLTWWDELVELVETSWERIPHGAPEIEAAIAKAIPPRPTAVAPAR